MFLSVPAANMPLMEISAHMAALSEQSSAEAYISRHLQGADQETRDAMREFLQGRSGGMQLGAAEEWHAALAAIMEGKVRTGAAIHALVPPQPVDPRPALRGLAALGPADCEHELRLVRSWLTAGTGPGAQVFFGANV